MKDWRVAQNSVLCYFRPHPHDITVCVKRYCKQPLWSFFVMLPKCVYVISLIIFYQHRAKLSSVHCPAVSSRRSSTDYLVQNSYTLSRKKPYQNTIYNHIVCIFHFYFFLSLDLPKENFSNLTFILKTSGDHIALCWYKPRPKWYSSVSALECSTLVLWCSNFDTGRADPITNHFAHTGSGSLLFTSFFLVLHYFFNCKKTIYHT